MKIKLHVSDTALIQLVINIDMHTIYRSSNKYLRNDLTLPIKKVLWHFSESFIWLCYNHQALLGWVFPPHKTVNLASPLKLTKVTIHPFSHLVHTMLFVQVLWVNLASASTTALTNTGNSPLLILSAKIINLYFSHTSVVPAISRVLLTARDRNCSIYSKRQCSLLSFLFEVNIRGRWKHLFPHLLQIHVGYYRL